MMELVSLSKHRIHFVICAFVVFIFCFCGCRPNRNEEMKTSRLPTNDSNVIHQSSQNATLQLDSSSMYWNNLNSPCSDDVLSLFVSSNGYIYAGTARSIVVSSDNGNSWEQTFGPCPPVLFIKEDGRKNIIARIGNGYNWAVVSTDKGYTWKTLVMNGDSIAVKIFLSENGSIMFQTKNNVWFYTNDLGVTWSTISIPNGAGKIYNSIGFRKDKQAITITDKKKILYSRDDGKTWIDLRTKYPYGYHTVNILDSGEFVVIMGNGSIYRSKNKGASWTEEKNERLRNLLVDLGGGHIFFSSETKGLLESFDGGVTLTSLGLSKSYITSAAFDADSNIIVGMYSRGIYRLGRNSNQWLNLTSGWSPSTVTSIEFDSDSTIYISTGNYGIYRSTSYGKDWKNISETLEDNIKSVLRGRQNSIYALEEYGSILCSTNKGITWDYIGISGIGNSRPISIAIDSSGVLYSGFFFGEIARYSETGKKLLPISSNSPGRLEQLLYDISTNSFYGLSVEYVPTDEGLHSGDRRVGTIQRSTDSCRTWKPICPGVEGVESIAIDKNGTIIIGTDDSGALRSKDQGKHWVKLINEVEDIAISSILICDSNSIVVGSTEGHLLATTDNGIHWNYIDAGLPSRREINFISMDRQSYLYIGGWGLGILKSSLPYFDLFRLKGMK